MSGFLAFRRSGLNGSEFPRNQSTSQLGGKPWTPETLSPGGNREVLSIEQFAKEMVQANVESSSHCHQIIKQLSLAIVMWAASCQNFIFVNFDDPGHSERALQQLQNGVLLEQNGRFLVKT